MDNYNYPEGTDNSSAPWNQEPKKPVDVVIDVYSTMTKRCEIPVVDYEGTFEDPYVKNCDFFNPFYENDYTIPELLSILQDYLEKDLKQEHSKEQKKELHNILKKCKEWKEQEIEIYQP